MKRIIHGVTYDTDTATKLGELKGSNAYGEECQALYRTELGELFLYERKKDGYLQVDRYGPDSDDVQVGNVYHSKERIAAMSFAEARFWAKGPEFGEDFWEGTGIDDYYVRDPNVFDRAAGRCVHLFADVFDTPPDARSSTS
jgi:hypothetical protein